MIHPRLLLDGSAVPVKDQVPGALAVCHLCQVLISAGCMNDF